MAATDLPFLASLLPSLLIVAVVLTLGIATTAAYGFYNAFLHPLSKYPGPKLWAAYRLPYVISACQGQLPFKVLELHRKYGPVVRIAPDELAFTEAQAFPDLQGRMSDRKQLPKDHVPYGPQMGSTERQILLAKDNMHARIRRIYAPAFTTQALEEQSHLVIKYANLLISTLKEAIKKDSPNQDMNAFYNYVTFDFTGEFTFDEPFHCLEQGGKIHFYLKTVLTGVLVGFKMSQFERYGLLTVLKPLLPKSAFQAKLDMDAYTGELVDRRRERGSIPGKVDIFSYVLQSKGEQLTREEMIDNGNVLVVAGSDTTSSLLAGATWHLCKRPDILAQVTSEVRSAFKTDEQITPKAVERLPYLIAVLTEAMRIFPPTPFGWPRIITDPAGQMIAGHHVPQGTNCSVFHWASSHSAQNFARPDDFCPERWADSPPPEFRSDDRDALQPFHVGPRGCLGKNLAYAEMRLIMAKMLWHFDLQLADPRDMWYERIRAFQVWARTPLMIRLTPVVR